MSSIEILSTEGHLPCRLTAPRTARASGSSHRKPARIFKTTTHRGPARLRAVAIFLDSECYNMRTLSTVAFFWLCIFLAPWKAQAQASCRPETNRADALRNHVVSLVTTTNAKLAAIRDSLRLPSAQSSDVVVVTDSTICAAAAAAVARAT